jgi:hypothetical protein
MNEEKITAVASILARWNPLGEDACNINDLDGYGVEAIDIISVMKIKGKSVKAERLVMEVLNQAFDLSLSPQGCIVPAQEIAAILLKNE